MTRSTTRKSTAAKAEPTPEAVTVTPPSNDETQVTAGEAAETDRDAVLRASYGAATKRLREENVTRFNELRVEEAAARGVTWVPPLSAEQKAEAELAALIEANPHLESVLRQQFAPVEYDPTV